MIVSLLVIGAASATTTAGATAGPSSSTRTLHRGGGYFAAVCGFSHRNDDDPIVFPGQRGRSHNHTYFGNTSTDADSSPASLRAAGQTTCRPRADTAAYWAPTLFSGANAVEPRGAVAYYVRRTFGAVDAFPAGLKIIAGDAAARAPQSQQVTYWTCAFGRVRSSSIPTCPGGRYGGLRLVVNFPNCWDGSRLDSANHKSHMAYSSNGACPGSHPVEVPALILVIYYGIRGGTGLELSSGGQFSGHADFVNAWDQGVLQALVDRYLNRSGFRK
jgi:hypothetical protein